MRRRAFGNLVFALLFVLMLAGEVLTVATVIRLDMLPPLYLGAMIGFFAILSFALFDLEFSLSSFSDGNTGFLVITSTTGLLPHTHTGKLLGQVQPRARCAKVFFTILSSREWNVITERTPPGFMTEMKSQIASSSILNSPFTSILTA